MTRGPFKLVTVNTAPERATRLVGRMIENLKDRYDIVHVANCESIEQVETTVAQHQPDILFCASMWTVSEADRIRSIARAVKPEIVTYAIPEGLHADGGPDAVVMHLMEHVPMLIESM